MSEQKPTQVVRDSMDRRGVDDPDNTYTQWRDGYLTQVDADFEHFQKANALAREAGLAEREGKPLEVNTESAPLSEVAAVEWKVLAVPAANLPEIRQNGLRVSDHPSSVPHLNYSVLAAPNFEPSGRADDVPHFVPADLLRVKSKAVAEFEDTHEHNPDIWPLLSQTEDENVYRYGTEGCEPVAASSAHPTL